MSYLKAGKDALIRKKEIITEDGRVIEVEIETTHGQSGDKLRPIPNNNYFNYTDGIVYVYDATDLESLDISENQYRNVMD